MLRISLGFWNNIIQPRHMELSLRVDDFQEGAEEAILDPDSPDLKPQFRGMGRLPLVGDKLHSVYSKKPMWQLDSFMGGDVVAMAPLSMEKVRRASLFDNKAANAGLSLDADVATRTWAVKGMIIHKHWIEVYHMKASTFEKLLRRYLRWGTAVGVGRQFRFHPFFFASNRLQQNDIDDPEHHEFINCQASVAMLAHWWIRESARELAGHNEKEQIAKQLTSSQSDHRDEALDKVLTKVAPHILMKPHKILFLWWTSKVQKDAKESLTNFITSSAVQEALAWDDDAVTEVIKEYEREKTLRKK